MPSSCLSFCKASALKGNPGWLFGWLAGLASGWLVGCFLAGLAWLLLAWFLAGFLAFWLVWFGSWLAFWLVWFGSWLAFWLVWFGSWLAFWLVWFGFLFFSPCFFLARLAETQLLGILPNRISRGHYFAATRLRAAF